MTRSDCMVNLAVDLRGEQCAAPALAPELAAIEAAGFETEQVSGMEGAFSAWIDDRFGGTWSSEAFAGKTIIAKRQGRFAGFVSYAPRGLNFAWLRGMGARPGVGIFGPFGVDPHYRGMGIGPHLLRAALAALRVEGYAQALIPAVGHEKLVRYYQTHGAAYVAETFERSQWRERRYRSVVLASGNGSNFQSVSGAALTNKLPLDVVALLSNNQQAYALQRAREAHVPALAVPWHREKQSRAQYDAMLIDAVRREAPELVLLLGWMHLLPQAFVAAFPHIINIHPAFLPLDQSRNEVTFPDGSVQPAFRGAHAVRDALSYGAAWIGASTHRVTLETDRGPLLTRKPLALDGLRTPEAIAQRLHPLEHRVLAGGIMRWVYEQ